MTDRVGRHEHHANPLDGEHAHPQPVGWLDAGAARLPVYDVAALDDGDIDRVSSFVTNFGSWRLPPEAAAVLGAQRCHLEWLHDTGELLLFGGVPQVGVGVVDVPASAAETAQVFVPAVFGGATAYGPSPVPGCVRQSFLEEQLPAGSRVALLTRIEHGPRVHEVLWGWHEHHGDPDGWSWLVARLAGAGDLGGDDRHVL